MRRARSAAGPLRRSTHRWKQASILAAAFRHDVPITVHPGIGYDIIATHPMFNGAAIGRAAQRDFAQFGAAVEGLDGGVVLSVGSAIMGPQVFEKSISCVNNLRLQAGPADRRRPRDLRRRPPGRRQLGLDAPASRPRPTPPITCGSARATPGWAARCGMCSATT